jgi:hypothetical protein
VFGSATLPSTIDASGSTFFDGTKGFKLFGETISDCSGYSVNSAGDVNGDGIGDIIISAYHWDLNTTITDAGRSYVVFGHRGAWPAVVELSSLNGKNGFTTSGNIQNEMSGWSVSGAGDINNDGLSDIIVGAPYCSSNAGRAVVVYGSFFAINCKTADTIAGKCLECDSGHGLSNDIPGTCVGCVDGTQWNTPPGQGCVNCTLGNGCLACGMTSGACTLCPDDRWIDGTGCKTCDAPCVSCNGTTKACTSCPSGMIPNERGCINGVTIVIKIDGDVDVDELQREIESILGSAVVVVGIDKGIIEVTVTDGTIADTLMDIIHRC